MTPRPGFSAHPREHPTQNEPTRWIACFINDPTGYQFWWTGNPCEFLRTQRDFWFTAHRGTTNDTVYIDLKKAYLFEQVEGAHT